MTRIFKSLLILLLICLQACSTLDKETEIEKAVEYFNNEEFEKALIYIDKLIKKDSSNYVAWAMKGKSLYNLGEETKGLTAINKAIHINPTYHEAYAYRAVMSNLSDKYEIKHVLSDLDIAIAHDPNNFEFLNFKANFLYKIKRYKQALDIYEKLLKSNSENYFLTIKYASTNRKLGNYNLALEKYNTAISIDPKQSIGFEERALLFMDKKKL